MNAIYMRESPELSVMMAKSDLSLTPWEGKVSGFTLLFEALLIQLCKAMPVHNVSDLTGVSDHKISPCLTSNTSTKSTTVL
jgi:hypothetical protein